MMKNFCLAFLMLLLPILDMHSQDSPDTERKIKVEHRYLNFPVDLDAPVQKLSVMVGKESYREFSILLASSKVDFWVHLDMESELGKLATIQLEKDAGFGLEKIYTSEQFAGYEDIYKEPLRPLVHFSAQKGWLNDPNGLVYHEGEYHLYFQHNPYGWGHGNMHWGHAVSSDLLHWKEEKIALTPPVYGDWAYSGSAVIDKHNTSGFGKEGIEPLVAIFTSTGRGECVTYSLDKGRNFTEYENNPVIEHDGRDPKVFWYEPDKKWVMVLFNQDLNETKNGQKFKNRVNRIYTSENLKDWEYQSEVPYYWECPELFELAVDGDPDHKKWVMYGGNTQYQIGTFDGKTFTPETSKIPFVDGVYSASQTYNNTPDGRRIMIGWLHASSIGMPFNQIMSFPVELRLATTEKGVRMLPRPVDELALLHAKKHEWSGIQTKIRKPFDCDVESDALHIIAEFDGSDDFNFGLEVNGYRVNYDNLGYKLDGFHMMPEDGRIRIEIIADRTSIEIFGNNGKAYTIRENLSEKREVKVYSSSASWHQGGHTSLKKLTVYELKSVWEQDN